MQRKGRGRGKGTGELVSRMRTHLRTAFRATVMCTVLTPSKSSIKKVLEALSAIPTAKNRFFQTVSLCGPGTFSVDQVSLKLKEIAYLWLPSAGNKGVKAEGMPFKKAKSSAMTNLCCQFDYICILLNSKQPRTPVRNFSWLYHLRWETYLKTRSPEVRKPTLTLGHTFWWHTTQKDMEEGSFCFLSACPHSH